MKAYFLFFIALLVVGCRRSEDRSRVQKNAIWSESIYFRGFQPTTGEKLTTERLRSFGETLRRNKIMYAYIFAGPFGKDGYLPGYAFSDTALNSVKFLREHYPEIVVLPWIGGVQNRTVYLGDSLWCKNALASTERLMRKLEVPGVHVDLEFILRGDPYLDETMDLEHDGDLEAYGRNVNEFHRRLRELLPHAFISSVVTATSPQTRPWKRKTSMEELKILINYVDQISFLFYDTQINDQQRFEEGCYALINDIQTLKSFGVDNRTQFLVSIGTFINRRELWKYRNLTLESIPNTLKTIIRSEASLKAGGPIVDGISIFCDWETEEAEWAEFYDNWVTEVR